MRIIEWINRRKSRAGRERGDLPGWVLITVMTAGLVAAIWFVAEDAIIDLVETALSDFR